MKRGHALRTPPQPTTLLIVDSDDAPTLPRPPHGDESAHRLSINRPTKRGKEKSRSDGHCPREKEMDDHLLACQQIFEIEPLSDTLW
jgi:hypothetical protein